MKRYKFGMLIICSIFLFMLVVSSCGSHTVYSPSRHIYTVDERGVVKTTEKESADSFPPPDDFLMASAVASDVILVGTVVGEGETVTVPMTESAPELTVTYTYYPIHVEETWYGETETDEIILGLYGDENGGFLPKVREGDALVLFLFQEKQDGRYYPSQAAFYAINPPDDTLFSFSADETLTSFDGKSVNTLKKAIEKKLKEFGKVEEDYVYWCGAVGKEYRSQALTDWLNGD